MRLSAGTLILLLGAALAVYFGSERGSIPFLAQSAVPNPDHASRGAFLHLRREGARGLSDQMVGAMRLAMQRVWS